MGHPVAEQKPSWPIDDGNHDSAGEHVLSGTPLHIANVAIDQPIIETYTKFYDPEDLSTHCEVFVSSTLTLADYEAITPKAEMDQVKVFAEGLRGKNVLRINATSAGGGVAIMIAPWLNIMQELGVDAHWHALAPDADAAIVTKRKFHNILQDVADPGEILTEDDKVTYKEWIAKNAEFLEEPIRKAEVIIIDDWQPSGLIQYIKGYTEQTPDGPIEHPGFNPDAKILFRDHIQTEGALMGTPGTPQHRTWQFLWEENRIKEADVFIAHPMDEFFPPDVPAEMAVSMPATCDLLDDLNRDLNEAELEAGYDFINTILAETRRQSPLDLSRPYIVLIARFDESKGMPEGLESYAKARQIMIDAGAEEKDIPQFVIIGNGSVDDPSGPMMLEKILDLREGPYKDFMDDLKVVRVPHDDRAINSVLTGAKLAMQPSTKEGFETRVTDAILKGVPIIGSNRGGIPLQIKEGITGHVKDPYDTDAWAARISELMLDIDAYESLQASTIELGLPENYKFTTIPNISRWLWLAQNVGEDFAGNKQWVDVLIREAALEAASEDISRNIGQQTLRLLAA